MIFYGQMVQGRTSNVMVLEINFRETVEEFTGPGTHEPMGGEKFREHVCDEERFHHGEKWTTLFEDDVAY
jgi:hypothetical protein